MGPLVKQFLNGPGIKPPHSSFKQGLASMVASYWANIKSIWQRIYVLVSEPLCKLELAIKLFVYNYFNFSFKIKKLLMIYVVVLGKQS